MPSKMGYSMAIILHADVRGNDLCPYLDHDYNHMITSLKSYPLQMYSRSVFLAAQQSEAWV